METKIEQGRGRWNKGYWTATFIWPKSCKHFCFRGKRDWMPKHDELAEIIETVLAIEPPDKREFLRKKFARSLKKGMAAPVKHNGREDAEADEMIKEMAAMGNPFGNDSSSSSSDNDEFE